MSLSVPYVRSKEEIVWLDGETETASTNEQASRRDPVNHDRCEGHAVDVVGTLLEEVVELLSSVGHLEGRCCDCC